MGDEPSAPARTPPGLMMRFLVVIFGVMMLGTAQAVASIGGPAAVTLGMLLGLLGVGIVVIAIGLVEWVAKRRRAG